MIAISLLFAQPLENRIPSAIPLPVVTEDIPELRLIPADVKQVKVSRSKIHGEVLMNISFSKSGNQRFIAIQKGRIGKKIAIYVGDKLLSEPIIYEYVHAGSIQISGGFTMMEAEELSQKLANNNMDFPVE